MFKSKDLKILGCGCGAVLLVLIIAAALFFSAVGKVGLNSGVEDATTGDLICPETTLSVLAKNKSLIQQLNKNIPIYKKAAEKNTIPWEALAALHYREHTLGTDSPNREGPFQLTSYSKTLGDSGGSMTINYRGMKRTITRKDLENFETSADLAANFLQGKVGNKLSTTSSENLIKDAFWAYNGRAYGSADRSPYVMNHFDEAHNNMIISGTVATSGGTKYIRNTDGKDGAYVVYVLLKKAKFNSDGTIASLADCTEVDATQVAGDTPPIANSGDRRFLYNSTKLSYISNFGANKNEWLKIPECSNADIGKGSGPGGTSDGLVKYVSSAINAGFSMQISAINSSHRHTGCSGHAGGYGIDFTRINSSPASGSLTKETIKFLQYANAHPNVTQIQLDDDWLKELAKSGIKLSKAEPHSRTTGNHIHITAK